MRTYRTSTVEIKREKFEETTRYATADTAKKLKEARAKTERLKAMRLAREKRNDS